MSIKNRTVIVHIAAGRSYVRRLSSILAGASASRMPGDLYSDKNPRYSSEGVLREPAAVIINGNPAMGDELAEVASSLAEVMGLKPEDALVALVGPVDRNSNGFEYRVIRVQPNVFAAGGVIKVKEPAAHHIPAAPSPAQPPLFDGLPRFKFSDALGKTFIAKDVKLPTSKTVEKPSVSGSGWIGEDDKLPNPWVSVKVGSPICISGAVRCIMAKDGLSLVKALIKVSALYPNMVVLLMPYAKCLLAHREDRPAIANARFAVRNGRAFKNGLGMIEEMEAAKAELKAVCDDAKEARATAGNFKGVTPEHNAGGDRPIERARRYHFEGGRVLELLSATRIETGGTWHRVWSGKSLELVDPAKVNHVLIVGHSHVGGPVVEAKRKVTFRDGSQLNLRNVTHLDVTNPAEWVIQHAAGQSRVNVRNVLHVSVS